LRSPSRWERNRFKRELENSLGAVRETEVSRSISFLVLFRNSHFPLGCGELERVFCSSRNIRKNYGSILLSAAWSAKRQIAEVVATAVPSTAQSRRNCSGPNLASCLRTFVLNLQSSPICSLVVAQMKFTTNTDLEINPKNDVVIASDEMPMAPTIMQPQ
jgi:hypothetical protein